MKFVPLILIVLFFTCASFFGQENSTTQTTQATESPKPPPAPAPANPPIDGDSTKLELLKSEKPIYPSRAQEQGIQGQVWLKLLISEAGDIENIEIVSGDPILAPAAVDAVKKWRFKPFMKNGKPVKVSTKIPLDFSFIGNVSDVKDKAGNNSARELGNNAPGKPIQIFTGVLSGLLVHKVVPVYPLWAKRNHITGSVLLHAVISKEGRIVNLKVMSGRAELIPSAIGAVQQWRYRPYLLLGQPVEVETTITVNFNMN